MRYGHHQGWGIYTHPFTHATKYAPDGPTAERGRIQPYRDKFLALACDIADMLGGALAVNVDYGYTIVPEQLEQLGYENPFTTWLKGSPSNYKGWGRDIVFSSKPAAGMPGQEYILLESGNEMVPWSTIRRIPTVGVLQFSQLLELLTF